MCMCLLTLRSTQCIVILRAYGNRISALETLRVANGKVHYETEQKDTGRHVQNEQRRMSSLVGQHQVADEHKEGHDGRDETEDIRRQESVHGPTFRIELAKGFSLVV